MAYTASKTAAALAFCDEAFAALPLRHRVVVCNREGLVDANRWRGWTVVSGSNAFGEFSGWQEGLDHLVSLGACESVLFLNDTVNTHRRFTAFRRRALVAELKKAPPLGVVGFIDSAYDRTARLSIAGLPLSGWVSTFCFLLGKETLERLEHRLFDQGAIDRCVNGGADEAKFFSESVSDDLRAQLRRWLFRIGGWYRSAPLDESNQAFFTHKARVICAELLLSARCWHVGAEGRDPFVRHPVLKIGDKIYNRLMDRLGLQPIEH